MSVLGTSPRYIDARVMRRLWSTISTSCFEKWSGFSDRPSSAITWIAAADAVPRWAEVSQVYNHFCLRGPVRTIESRCQYLPARRKAHGRKGVTWEEYLPAPDPETRPRRLAACSIWICSWQPPSVRCCMKLSALVLASRRRQPTDRAGELISKFQWLLLMPRPRQAVISTM